MGAVSTNDLLENERTLAQMDSRLSDLVHDVPRTEAAISEISRKRTEVQLRYRSDAERSAPTPKCRRPSSKRASTPCRIAACARK
jgi:hypothetical protein